MNKLIELINEYEELIINEESSKKQMLHYLKIERYMTKNDLSNKDLFKALEEVGAANPMSIIHDWFEDLEYRMVVK